MRSCNCFELRAKHLIISAYLEAMDTSWHGCLVREETSVTTEITFRRRDRHILYFELYHIMFVLPLLFLYTRKTSFYSVHMSNKLHERTLTSYFPRGFRSPLNITYDRSGEEREGRSKNREGRNTIVRRGKRWGEGEEKGKPDFWSGTNIGKAVSFPVSAASNSS